MNRASRPVLLLAVLALVTASCGGDAPSLEEPPPTEATTTSSTATTSSTTTTTLPGGPAMVQVGDKNPTVEALQFLLVCAGYGDLTIDGSFGPATEAVVEEVQAQFGRQVTGAPDEETFAGLARTCFEPRPLPGDKVLPVEVVGNAAPEDPDILAVSIEAPATLTVTIVTGDVTAGLTGPEGAGFELVGVGMWEIDTSGDYLIEVSSALGPVTYSLTVLVEPREAEVGQWIIAGDGLTYQGKRIKLGDPAEEVIEKILEYFGHGVRGRYDEFDTGWYEISDPQVIGLRGIFIEGFAFLFFGPSSAEPSRAETLSRIRFEGPSDDAEGNPRPDDYATTAAGITVGDTLAALKAAYGDSAKSGSNSTEHYYRLSDSGKTLCFYFGASAPSDTSKITEIATECRTG